MAGKVFHSGASIKNGRIDLGSGLPRPSLLILGHYCGKEELEAEEPFVGSAGRNLLLWLSLLAPGWINLKEHPWSPMSLQSRTKKRFKGFWQRASGGGLRIVNCRESENLHWLVSKEAVRTLLAANSDLRVLALGSHVARHLGVRGSGWVGPIEPVDSKLQRVFCWWHPDARSNNFFGGLANRERRVALCKFLDPNI